MFRYRLLILNSLLLSALLLSQWGRHSENTPALPTDFLRPLHLPFRDWQATDTPVSPADRALLEPDALLLRRYQSASGEAAELAVIAGHRKKSLHTPAFCMAGSGWQTLWEQNCQIALPGRNIPAVRALMTADGRQILLTYFFTDGDYATRSLVQFQGAQLWKRFHAQLPLGALVRIIVPVRGGENEAQQTTAAFSQGTLPAILESLRQARKNENKISRK